MIRTFRRKPEPVQAVQWTGSNVDEMRAFAGGDFDTPDEVPYDDDPDATASFRETVHGTWVLLYDGDWLVRTPAGDLSRYRDVEMAVLFEPVG